MVKKCPSDIPPMPTNGVKFRTIITSSAVEVVSALPINADGGPPPGVQPNPESPEAKQAQQDNRPWFQKYVSCFLISNNKYEKSLLYIIYIYIVVLYYSNSNSFNDARG